MKFDRIFNQICWLILITVIVFNGCKKHLPEGDYPFQPVPFKQVKMTDNFWQPRMETNRTVTIRHILKKNEETGRVDNFAIASGLKEGKQKGVYPFDDTDVYKVMEAASFAIMAHPDPELEAYMDSVITIVAAAQEEDGYLFTARTNNAQRSRLSYGETRWSHLARSHELYNAGHLFEAAAAHYQATGKRTLLDVALKFADLIDDVFGPSNPDLPHDAEMLHIPPGHQVIEMGLAKLFRITSDEKYLDLAKFFLDMRGKSIDGRKLGGSYNQDHKPVLEQYEAVGHAVRAGYQYAGMADIAALSNNESYIDTIEELWENVAGKKLYITGGIGSRASIEGFGDNYDLPNMSAYNETCSSIANIYWQHRQFLLHGNAKYLDVMERTLYNAFLSGISLEGNKFFYPNPLESVGQSERSEWFTCACCPGNVARFLASIPGYIYSRRQDHLFVNLYASNQAEILISQQKVQIEQKTNYPWDGKIKIKIVPEANNLKMTLNLRIPGWAMGNPIATDLYTYINEKPAKVEIKLNGQPFPLRLEDGFAQVAHNWQSGDLIELNLPMKIRRVLANDKVVADLGRTALERGPIVYCAEWPDHNGGHVRNLLLSDESKLTSEFLPHMLHGIQVLRGEAVGYSMLQGKKVKTNETDLFAIPYYAWAHRGPGEMAVWLAREESAVHPLGLPALASESKVTASLGDNQTAVNDQLDPENTGNEAPYYYCLPNKDSIAWIQYDFSEEQEVSIVDVYWFDDSGSGECRVPESWKILYIENGEWKKVYTPGTYGTEKNQYNRVIFETVRTKHLRLEIKPQKGYAGGIYEWKVK